MNKYIDYIEKMKLEVDIETYIDLINGFKIKLQNWTMEKPRFSDDDDYVEMTTAMNFISKEILLNTK